MENIKEIIREYKELLESESSMAKVMFNQEYPNTSRANPMKKDLCLIGVNKIEESASEYIVAIKFSVYVASSKGGDYLNSLSQKIQNIVSQYQSFYVYTKKSESTNISYDRATESLYKDIHLYVSFLDEIKDEKSCSCVKMIFKDIEIPVNLNNLKVLQQKKVGEEITISGFPIVTQNGYGAKVVQGKCRLTGKNSASKVRKIWDVFECEGDGWLIIPGFTGIIAIFKEFECKVNNKNDIEYQFEFIESRSGE